MASYEITCVVFSSFSDERKHQHITHVGTNIGLQSVENVISCIKAEIHDFYVVENITGKKIPVHVVEHGKSGRPYIRTMKDGVLRDNLLHLRLCAK